MWQIHVENGAQPAGSKIHNKTLRHNGVDWEVWESSSHGGFYTFRPVSTSICSKSNGVLTCKGKLGIRKFLVWLMKEKYIDGEYWMEVVEMGNEVFGQCNGSTTQEGTTIVKKFRVHASA